MNENCSLMNSMWLDEKIKMDDYHLMIIEVDNNMGILDIRVEMSKRLIELAKTIRNA
jgi:hypothetical protein